MTQSTLTGKVTIVKVPETTLAPAEKKILNCLRYADRGLTHDQIKNRMILSGISVFDNKLRSLRQKGYVVNYPAPDGTLLWFAKEAIEDEVY